ncbi:MAG TPA: hypothetical protein VEY70_25865 [Metabacillus sp.]|nr:hypothetical protein [Metabacillus sp.]
MPISAKLNVSALVRAINPPALIGPSRGKSTSPPGATVAALSGGIKA